MKDRQTQEASEQGPWQIESELPQEVFVVLRKPDRALDPITIVATIDSDGAPHTAPFGSLRAFSPRSLRLICFRHHDTYANFCHDGRVMIAVLAPPDIAVSIRGRARVIKERMDTSEQHAIVTIDVEEVRNDMVRWGVIESGITFSAFDHNIEWFTAILGELEGL